MTGGGNQMIGGGNLIAFDLGTREAAFNFLNALGLVDISNNLGDARSMATHPTTTTHRAMTEEQRLEIGLTPGWVRLSAGLEGAGDLARDIEQALDKA
jgi:O-succinylhomoserine sulfhydrylase